MDTTEPNIKMCEKADEIWNNWEYRIGDYVVFRDVGRFDKPVRVRLVSYVNNSGSIFLVGDHEFQSYSRDNLYPNPTISFDRVRTYRRLTRVVPLR